MHDVGHPRVCMPPTRPGYEGAKGGATFSVDVEKRRVYILDRL